MPMIPAQPEKKIESVEFRVSPSEKEGYRQRAKEMGLELSDYMRRAAELLWQRHQQRKRRTGQAA